MLVCFLILHEIKVQNQLEKKTMNDLMKVGWNGKGRYISYNEKKETLLNGSLSTHQKNEKEEEDDEDEYPDPNFTFETYTDV